MAKINKASNTFAKIGVASLIIFALSFGVWLNFTQQNSDVANAAIQSGDTIYQTTDVVNYGYKVITVPEPNGSSQNINPYYNGGYFANGSLIIPTGATVKKAYIGYHVEYQGSPEENQYSFNRTTLSVVFNDSDTFAAPVAKTREFPPDSISSTISAPRMQYADVTNFVTTHGSGDYRLDGKYSKHSELIFFVIVKSPNYPRNSISVNDVLFLNDTNIAETMTQNVQIASGYVNDPAQPLSVYSFGGTFDYTGDGSMGPIDRNTATYKLKKPNGDTIASGQLSSGLSNGSFYWPNTSTKATINSTGISASSLDFSLNILEPTTFAGQRKAVETAAFIITEVPVVPDTDGDGIADVIEIGDNTSTPRDTDGDGTPDYRDSDSDNDGILDSVESSIDTDGDGVPDYRDLDSDGDGLSDNAEAVKVGDPLPKPGTVSNPYDTDGDGIPDYRQKKLENPTDNVLVGAPNTGVKF